MNTTVHPAEAINPQAMRYTFYVDGVGIEMHAVAQSQKRARELVWNALTEEQKNATRCLDWIDTGGCNPYDVCAGCRCDYTKAAREAA